MLWEIVTEDIGKTARRCYEVVLPVAILDPLLGLLLPSEPFFPYLCCLGLYLAVAANFKRNAFGSGALMLLNMLF